MKTSKVLVANFDREWSNANGTFYNYNVIFENTDSGVYVSKSSAQDKFVVGQEAHYELIKGQQKADGSFWPDKIKPVNPEYQGKQGGGFQGRTSPEERRSIERQSALKAAVEFAGYYISKGDKISPKDVRMFAIAFYDFIARGETTKEAKPESVPYPQPQEKTGIPGVTIEDEPPF